MGGACAGRHVRLLCTDSGGVWWSEGGVVHPSWPVAASGLLTPGPCFCSGCSLCVFVLWLAFCLFADNLRIPRSLRRGGSNVRAVQCLDAARMAAQFVCFGVEGCLTRTLYAMPYCLWHCRYTASSLTRSFVVPCSSLVHLLLGCSLSP